MQFISEPMLSTSLNFLATKKPHKPPSKKQVERTILNSLLMEILPKKNLEKSLTSSSISTSAVLNVNYQKCICKLLEIELLENVIPVPSSEIWTINIGLLLSSLKTLLLPKAWLLEKWSRDKSRRLRRKARERARKEKRRNKTLRRKSKKSLKNKFKKRKLSNLILKKWISEANNLRNLDNTSRA